MTLLELARQEDAADPGASVDDHLDCLTALAADMFGAAPAPDAYITDDAAERLRATYRADD